MASPPKKLTSDSGKSSREYKKVKENMENIIGGLRTAIGARDILIVKYKEREWISETANATEEQLVSLALERIRQKADQFNIFMDMIKDTKGLDLIVDSLELRDMQQEQGTPMLDAMVPSVLQNPLANSHSNGCPVSGTVLNPRKELKQTQIDSRIRHEAYTSAQKHHSLSEPAAECNQHSSVQELPNISQIIYDTMLPVANHSGANSPLLPHKYLPTRLSTPSPPFKQPTILPMKAAPVPKGATVLDSRDYPLSETTQGKFSSQHKRPMTTQGGSIISSGKCMELQHHIETDSAYVSVPAFEFSGPATQQTIEDQHSPGTSLPSSIDTVQEPQNIFPDGTEEEHTREPATPDTTHRRYSISEGTISTSTSEPCLLGEDEHDETVSPIDIETTCYTTDADLVHSIMERLQQKDEKIKKLEEEKQETDKRNKTIIKTLEEEKKKDKDELQCHKTQIAELEKNLRQKMKENEKLQNSLKQTEQFAKHSELKSQALQEKIKELQEKLQKEREKVEEKQIEVKNIELQLEQTKLKLEKQDNCYKDKIRAVERERDRIKVQLAELKAHIAEQEQRNEEEKRHAAEEEKRKLEEKYREALEKLEKLQRN